MGVFYVRLSSPGLKSSTLLHIFSKPALPPRNSRATKIELVDTFLPFKLRRRHHKSTPMITKHTQPCLVIGGPFGQATMALCNGFLVNLVSELCGGLLVLEQENEGFLLMVPLNTCSDCLEPNRNVLESHPEASTINRIRLYYTWHVLISEHTHDLTHICHVMYN